MILKPVELAARASDAASYPTLHFEHRKVLYRFECPPPPPTLFTRSERAIPHCAVE